MSELSLTSSSFLIAMVVVFLWTLPWKGIALWRAAREGHRGWFILLLLINTLAILEIIYIFFISKRERTKLY